MLCGSVPTSCVTQAIQTSALYGPKMLGPARRGPAKLRPGPAWPGPMWPINGIDVEVVVFVNLLTKTNFEA